MAVLLLVAIAGGIWFYLKRQNQQANTQAESPSVPRQSTETKNAPQQNLSKTSEKTSSATDKFIIKNPVNLSQIWKISKFRSCSGHDFSGLNVFGQTETNRSMKHYFAIKQSLRGTQEVKVFAPFDALIEEIDYQNEPGDYEVYLRGPNSWIFIFQHITPRAGLKVGSIVRAGEEMGSAYVPAGGQSFDIALKQFVVPQKYQAAEQLLYEKMVKEGKTREQAEQETMQELGLSEPPPKPEQTRLDSIFFHMTDSVLAEYKQRGITLDNIIISKEYRDAHPCNFNIDYDREEDWVVVKQRRECEKNLAVCYYWANNYCWDLSLFYFLF